MKNGVTQKQRLALLEFLNEFQHLGEVEASDVKVARYDEKNVPLYYTLNFFSKISYRFDKDGAMSNVPKDEGGKVTDLMVDCYLKDFAKHVYNKLVGRLNSISFINTL